MRSTFVLIALLVAVNARSLRQKREVDLRLPDGVESLLNSPLRTITFRCDAPGYYADVENNCQLFHICSTSTSADGLTEMRQHSFACGNQTVFNQATMTCSRPEDSIPCAHSPQYYRSNSNVGLEKAPVPVVPVAEKVSAPALAVSPVKGFEEKVTVSRVDYSGKDSSARKGGSHIRTRFNPRPFQRHGKALVSGTKS